MSNSLGSVGYQNLAVSANPTNGQILSYDSSVPTLKWVDSSAVLTLNAGEIQIGNSSNVVTKEKLCLKARYLDNAYLTPNLPVPGNQGLVLCVGSVDDSLIY